MTGDSSKSDRRNGDGGIEFKIAAASPQVSDTQTLQALLDESLYSGRFFSKLIAEVIFLRADRVLLRSEQDSVRVVVKDGDRELKSMHLGREWFVPLWRYLGERQLAFGPLGSRELIAPESDNCDFTTALRVDDILHTFRARKSVQLNGAKLIALSGFSATPVANVLANLAMSDFEREAFGRLLACQLGFLILAAPEITSLARARALVLSLSNGHSLRQFSRAELRERLPSLAQSNLIVVSLLAQDALDAALEARAQGAEIGDRLFQGVICQSFVKGVCEGCARSATPAPGLIALLPEELRHFVSSAYSISRGCAKCSAPAVCPQLLLQSLIVANDNLRQAFSRSSDPQRLAEELYVAGTRPLFEEGLRRVSQGRVTLEALFDVLKAMPEPFRKIHRARFLGQGSQSLDVAALGNNAGQASAAKTESAKQPQLSGSKVLIVEDNADQSGIIEMVLRGVGYDARSAGDGLEALGLLASGYRPDLIMVDLMMPRMDGRELIMKLKSQDEYRDIPILVLTVVSDSEREYDILDIGADDYCEKTIQRKVLLKRIENLLRRSVRPD